MGKKYVICSVDDNYEDQLFVMLTSLYKNNKSSNFHILIMCEKLNEYFIEKIYSFFSHIKNLTFEFIFLNDTLLDAAIIFGHISKATYYRLIIPKVLNNHIDRVLYLDVDLIVTKDIGYFWECEIESYSHLGVVNLGMDINYKKNLGMSDSSTYFNAGVLMINLNWWKENGVYEKSLNFILDNPEKIKLWDQDVLNVVLESKWFELPFEYNAQEPIFRTDMFNFFNPKYYLEAFFNPKIIHYSGGGHSKPWHKECRHLNKNEYVYYCYLARKFQKNTTNWLFFLGKDIVLSRFTFNLFYLEKNYKKLLYFLIVKMNFKFLTKFLF